MTRYIFILSFLITFQSIAQQKSSNDSSTTRLVLSGVYTSKNLYIQNPLSDVANSIYCTDSIVINGKLYKTYLDQSAYEIDLNSFVKIMGTDVTVIIYHKKACKPKSLSTIGFPPLGNKLQLTSFEIDSSGHVLIRELNEPNGNTHPLHIDQYRALKWRTVMIIPRKYGSENIYDTVIKLTAGRNTFQLSKYPYTYSSTMTNVQSGIPYDTCIYDSSKMCITCSDTVYYQIEDRCMNILDSGYAKNIDVSQCYDAYLMYYDNQLYHFDIKPLKKENLKQQ